MPPAEISKMFKMLQKNDPLTKKAAISAPDIFKFILIESKEDLDIYRKNPNDSKLTSFKAFCSDFLMEAEDESEQFAVEGYQELAIHVLINQRTMQLCIKHSFKLSGKPSISVAEIVQKILEDFPEINKPGISSLEDFEKGLEKDALMKIVQDGIKGKADGFVQFERTDDGLECLSTGNSGKIQSSETLDTAILGCQFVLRFFIDAGSKIDHTDPNWTFFFAFEDDKITGFLSGYYFHLSSFEFKIRISQVIVLPPFRKQRIGVGLVNQLYTRYLADERCTKVTVEDPNDSFTHIQFKIWVSVLQSMVTSHSEFKSLEVNQPLSKVSLKPLLKKISEKVKCNNENSDSLLDLFLLSKAKSETKVKEFKEYLTNKVKTKRENDRKTHERKIAKKFIVFEDKTVSTAKITKLYAEIDEEAPQDPEEEVAQRLFHFLDNLPQFRAIIKDK